MRKLAEKYNMGSNILKMLRARDPRYPLAAYVFVFEALDYTIRKVVGQKRHVTGRELLEGIRLLAIEQFGPMARMVFRAWGIERTEDFGNIVFNLVESSLMGKTDSDSIDDFREGFCFDEAFSLDATVSLTPS